MNAFADSSAVEQILYNGVVNETQLNLSTEKTKTEYRTERVPSICYRTEYRYRCTHRPPMCRTVCTGRGICRNVCSGGGQQCRNVPTQVSYRCMRTVTRSYQVHDYFVETNVKLQFDNSDVAETVHEQFSVSVTGDRVSLSVNSSKNYFLVLENELRSEQMGTGTKYVDMTYKVRLVAASAAKSVFANGIQNVSLRNGVLNFKLGAGFDLRKFTQQIKIFQNRRLRSDILILDKYLSQSDMNIQTNANESILSIDLNNLGVKVPAKVRVVMETKFLIDTKKVINKNEISTSANANWVFR